MKIYPKAHLAEVLKAVSNLPKEHEGRISWESEALDRASFEILYNLNFKTPVEDYIKDGAVWHALNECARAKSFAAPFFIGKLRAYLEDLLSKKDRSFTAVMQINAEIGARLPKKIASVGGSVDIQTSLLRACLKVISGLKGYERSRLNLQDGFVYAIAKVSSANDRSALDIAYRRMKYALGVLNLAIRGYGVSKRFGLPNAPIGTILSASPVFVVDTAAGKLGNWQTENHYPTPWKQNFRVWQAQPTEDIATFAKHVASDLSRIDFAERLVQSVLLLQEGLETGHVEVALLKFWTGIEVLCAREEREPTERIVERASSIFDDYQHAAMRLSFIQEFRNKIVHRGEAGDHALLCAQYGSLYLAALIRFFLWNIYEFRKRDMILDFLSLPLDAQKLQGNITLNRKRLAALKRMKARMAAQGSS
jgi:hypothetical protein